MSIASTLLTALLVLASLQVSAVAAAPVAGPHAGSAHGQTAGNSSAPAPVAVSATERATLTTLQANSQGLEAARGGDIDSHATEIILGLIGAIFLLWVLL